MKEKRREEKVLIAGFGGQGIMFLGRIIAEAAVLENKFATHIRSYGAEMRGGTAHCLVKINDSEISSPVFKKASVAIIMNQPSLEKFKKLFTEGSVVIANKSLIEKNFQSEKIKLFFYHLNEMAYSLGDLKVANIIALGVLLKKYKLVSKQSAIGVLKEKLRNKERLLALNLKALELGWKKA